MRLADIEFPPKEYDLANRILANAPLCTCKPTSATTRSGSESQEILVEKRALFTDVVDGVDGQALRRLDLDDLLREVKGGPATLLKPTTDQYVSRYAASRVHETRLKLLLLSLRTDAMSSITTQPASRTPIRISPSGHSNG
jgi:hypothetical protein